VKQMIELFRKVLERYRFTEAVSIEIQSQILSSRKMVLDSVLKSVGQYSTLYSIAASMNLVLRKTGLRATMAQSKIILAAIAVIVTGSLSTGVIYGIITYKKSVVPGQEKITRNKTIDDKSKSFSAPKIPDRKISKKDNYPVSHIKHKKFRYNIGIQKFKGSDTALTKKFTDQTAMELNRQLEKDQIINLRKEKRRGLLLIISTLKQTRHI